MGGGGIQQVRYNTPGKGVGVGRGVTALHISQVIVMGRGERCEWVVEGKIACAGKEEEEEEEEGRILPLLLLPPHYPFAGNNTLPHSSPPPPTLHYYQPVPSGNPRGLRRTLALSIAEEVMEGEEEERDKKGCCGWVAMALVAMVSQSVNDRMGPRPSVYPSWRRRR